jgi:hypothetical protein
MKLTCQESINRKGMICWTRSLEGSVRFYIQLGKKGYFPEHNVYNILKFACWAHVARKYHYEIQI